MSYSRVASGRSGFSDTSSAAEATERFLKRHAVGSREEEEDLMEQKKSLQEAVFSSMYTLARSKTADSRAWAAAKTVLEGLVPFLVVFNQRHWALDTSNPLLQVVRWAQPVTPVSIIWGYNVYIRIFYALVAVIYSVVIAIAALTIAMRRQDHSKWLHRFARLLQRFTDLMFGMLYVAIFDFLVFLFNCRFGTPGHPHNAWPDVQCLSGMHAVHLAVAGVTAMVFFVTTALMLVASCDLSPVARGLLASPAAITRLQVLCLKAAFVLAADTLVAVGKPQAVVMAVLPAAITYVNFRALPFLRLPVNDIWVGIWSSVLYMCIIHATMDLSNGRDDKKYPMIVLYGIVPAFLAGTAVTALWGRYRLRGAPQFQGLDPAAARATRAHKFSGPDEVELLARAMRHFNSDGVLLEQSAQLGETIIKYGMAAFPNDAGLLVLYANFLLDVRRDGPAARTQLQLALKSGPSIVQRYGIFCTVENSKRLKDGQGGNLDLQSYVEFKRNYRAVIRVHKSALAAQREVWQLLQRPAVRSSAVEVALKAMVAAADAAHQVYRRVLDRYPNNGKLLRCYGKFLEDVRNDPIAATRAYSEAARNGGGDGLLSLDLQFQGADKPEFITSMDIHEDACIIINAEGKILMVNSCVTDLLGYIRAELEGANVSMIMPQPFSSRHASYLERYAQGGEPHILDTVRDVVALHKDRYVFPLQLCVTKLSGIGKDAVFLGVLRPAPFDAHNVRAWVAPNGVILCTDPQFASLTGMLGEEMVGRNFRTLVTDMAAVDSLLELCKSVPYQQLVAGEIIVHLEVVHRYLPPIPVAIKVTPGGTDAQRILVLNAHRTDGATEGLMVVDSRGALAFATWDVAAMLGYPLRSFLRMKLEQLLPQPFATMHAKHLKAPAPTVPPISCRAGIVVHMLHCNGAQVAVRLRVSSREDELAAVHTGDSALRHVVQVSKVDSSSAASLYSDRRVCLTCTMDGRILSVDQPMSNLFGFPAGAMVGSNLAECIDVFSEWRTRAGAHQLELLLLSLLDKEAEMPGTSWRVKVHSPDTEEEAARSHLPGPARPRTSYRRPVGQSACLQTEIIDGNEYFLTGANNGSAGFGAGGLGTGSAQGVPQTPGGQQGKAMFRSSNGGGGSGGSMNGSSASAVAAAEAEAEMSGPAAAGRILARVILWRRDLLTGVVELDERLVIRKADTRTGLIVGLPPSALQKLPLYRLLDINKGITWDDLTASERKKPALKGAAMYRMSEPRAFIGPHPDGGTMRIILQGVSGGAGGRITATLHPDTTYVGARANVYRALGLEALILQHNHQQAAGGQSRPVTRARLSRNRTLRASQRPRSSRPTLEGRQQQEPSTGQPPPPPLRGRSSQKLLQWQASLEQWKHPSGAAGNEAVQKKPSILKLGDPVEAEEDVKGRDEAKVEAGDEELPGPDGGRSRPDGAGAGGDEGDEEEEEEEGDEEGEEGKEGEEEDDGSSSSSKDSDGSNSSRIRRAETRQINLDKRSSGGSSASSGGSSSGSGRKRRLGAKTASGVAAAAGSGVAGDSGGSPGAAAATDATRLYKVSDSQSQSQFISQWVRSLSRQMTAAGILRSAANSKQPSRRALLPGEVPGGPSGPHRSAGLNDDTTALLIRASTRLLADELGSAGGSRQRQRGAGGRDVGEEEGPPVDPLLLQPTGLEGLGLEGYEGVVLGGKGLHGGGGGSPHATTRPGSEDGQSCKGGGGGRRGSGDGDVGKGKPTGPAAPASDNGGGSSQGDDDDASQGTAGQGFSDFTSGVDVDLATDARRTRLLKRMGRVLFGPSLAVPLRRLFVHTLLLLLAMAATHVICYAVLMALINEQYGQVHMLHRTALAADRSQVAAIKAAVAEFCSRPGIEPVSVCELSLNATVVDIRSSLDDLETYHQGIYLGVAGAPKQLQDPTLMHMWTNSVISYRMFLDVAPPRWVNLTAGVWQLGNRFIATGRELLYWTPRLAGRISDMRAFHFLLANGPWSLFSGYAATLDRLAAHAWEDVLLLEKNLIILLAIEAAVVQLACIAYEWSLVQRVEAGRRGNMLVGLGLPGPILRILASRPLVVLEDSDDEGEEGDEADGMPEAHEGPSRRSLDAGDPGATFTANGTAFTGDGGVVSAGAGTHLPHRVSIDHPRAGFGGAGRTAYQRTGRASIDFAPIRNPAGLDAAGPTDGGPMSAPLPYGRSRASLEGSRPHHLLHDGGSGPGGMYGVNGGYGGGHHRRTGRASIDFAPLRTGAHPDDSAWLPSLPPPPPLLSPPAQTSLASPSTVKYEAAPASAWSVEEPVHGKRPAPLLLAVEVVPLDSEPLMRAGSQKPAPVTPASVYGGGIGGSSVASGVSGISGGGGGVGSASGVWGGAKRGPAVAREGPNRTMVNGKTLLSGRRHVLKFMVPLVVWELCLVVVGVLSYMWLENMQGPLASLNMASHVIYRYTRVRMTAFFLVASTSATERSEWRGVLGTELANLRDEYETLLYGGVSATQSDAVFQRSVPASTFESSSFAANFFREERCFRWDQSKCYSPDSPYYEVTHHGLDVMMRRILSEMELLVADEDSDAVYNGTRYTTMYAVGVRDLYEGLQSSALLFVDYMISRYENVKLLNTILLVVTLVLFVAYALFVLRPYRSAVELEAGRLAGLLSHVPVELDVATHARAVLREYGRVVGVEDAASRRRRVAVAATRGAQIRDVPRRASDPGSTKPLLLGSGV